MENGFTLVLTKGGYQTINSCLLGALSAKGVSAVGLVVLSANLDLSTPSVSESEAAGGLEEPG